MTCAKCDEARRIAGDLNNIGRPCDICADSGIDYLQRPCRHCRPDDHARWKQVTFAEHYGAAANDLFWREGRLTNQPIEERRHD